MEPKYLRITNNIGDVEYTREDYEDRIVLRVTCHKPIKVLTEAETKLLSDFIGSPETDTRPIHMIDVNNGDICEIHEAGPFIFGIVKEADT